MDHNQEEQTLELEALESIYPTELTFLEAENDDPDDQGKLFAIELTPDEQTLAEDTDLFSTAELESVIKFNILKLVIRYRPTYPSRSLPHICLTAKINTAQPLTPHDLPQQPPSIPDHLYLDSRECEQLRQFIQEEAYELSGLDRLAMQNGVVTDGDSDGCVIVFALASAVRTKLTEMLQDKKQAVEDERNAIIAEQDAINAAKSIGTKVTVASFNAWKEKFDKEMATIKKQTAAESTNTSKKGNALTGKQLWESNAVTEALDELVLADDEFDVDYNLIEKELDDLDLDLDEGDGEIARILAEETED